MNNTFKVTLMSLAVLLLFSCKKDDDTTTANIIPLSEQAPIDDAALVEFLTNNYYNEEEFSNRDNITNFDFNIDFSEEASVTGYDANGDGVIDSNDGPDHNTVYNRQRLIDLVETKVITIDDVDHNLYILRTIQGSTNFDKPRFCDSTFVAYKGLSLEKELFDSSVNPTWFDLTSTVRGFTDGLMEFNPASKKHTTNSDGTFEFEDFGVGAIFMPSGLGYYAVPIGGLPGYSPLIFTIKLMSTEISDHDNDKIPTYLEDLDDDRDLRSDDTDNNTVANYGDTDDDGDGVLTKDEVEIPASPYVINLGDPDPVLGANEYILDKKIQQADENKIEIFTVIFKDTDNDGTPDHLDADTAE